MIGSARVAGALGAALLLVAGYRVAAVFRDPVGPSPPEGIDAVRRTSHYETSSTCRPCHPDHEASWKRTFHRTMTRDAGPETVQAPFDGRELSVPGGRATMRRNGDTYFIDMPDPGSEESVPHRIVRVTGSRRMQQFETRIDDRYVRLPVAWSIVEGRWLHLSEAFFDPDGGDLHAHRAVWDLNCIFCHTTHPVPGLDHQDRLASTTAELGVACEACHGPGGEHARRMRSPLRRYAMRIGNVADPTIVDPLRLDRVRSVQLCGHCHGQRLPADRDAIRQILATGDPYVPGDDLSQTYAPVTRETTIGSFSFAPRFWADGSPRLTAYEYQGVLGSPCYVRGSMTCLSCHTMHAGDPRGQLRPDRPGDALCTQCHGTYVGARLTEHTGHRSDSSGSRCVACHMPPVVYGIMSWHPTHLISSPDPGSSRSHGMPDACTLCHSGRSSAWAANEIARLWPRRTTPPLPASASSDPTPEIVRALFAGDPVYRALAAERLGDPSPDSDVDGRIVPLVAEALLDDYPNVRRIARASLAKLTGQGDLPQALDPLNLRKAVRDRLQAAAPRRIPSAGWPFLTDGALDRRRIEGWKHERSEAPVSIGE